MSAKTKRSTSRKIAQRANAKEPQRQTRKRIRKIVERHRETFDELAK